MRGGSTWVRVGVAVLVAAGLVGGYFLYQHLRGRHHLGAAREALEARDFARARDHLDDCLGVWPGDLEVLLLSAQAARQAGDHEDAASRLEAFRKQGGPASAFSLEVRLARIQRGDLTELDVLLDYCKDHPDAAETPLILEALLIGLLDAIEPAFALGQTKETDPVGPYVARAQQAADLWMRRCASRADHVQGLIWRSRAYAFANDYAKAVADAREAIRLDPNNVEARLHLATPVLQEDPHEAAGHLEQVLRHDPRNNRARFALATTRCAQGRLAEARQLLDGLLADATNSVATFLLRGRTSLDEGRAADAEPFLRRALALAPDEPSVYAALSRCMHQAGREAEAARLRDRARELEAERKRRKPTEPERAKGPGGA